MSWFHIHQKGIAEVLLPLSSSYDRHTGAAHAF